MPSLSSRPLQTPSTDGRWRPSALPASALADEGACRSGVFSWARAAGVSSRSARSRASCSSSSRERSTGAALPPLCLTTAADLRTRVGGNILPAQAGCCEPSPAVVAAMPGRCPLPRQRQLELSAVRPPCPVTWPPTFRCSDRRSPRSLEGSVTRRPGHRAGCSPSSDNPD